MAKNAPRSRKRQIAGAEPDQARDDAADDDQGRDGQRQDGLSDPRQRFREITVDVGPSLCSATDE